MKRVWILVAIGCGSSGELAPPASHVATTAAVTAPVPACPWGADDPWSHEVFPGCSAMPFHNDFQVCAGECPRPCGKTFDEDGGPAEISTIRYDPRGRWIEQRRTDDHPGTPRVESCDYDAAGMARCRRDEQTFWIRRDAEHRIIKVLVGHDDTPPPDDSLAGAWVKYRYDGRSRVVENGSSLVDYRYDDRGRLVAEIENDADRVDDSTILSYGSRGELVRRYGKTRDEHFEYDARGRLAKVAVLFVATDDEPAFHDVTELTYDDGDRLVRDRRTRGKARSSSVFTTAYRYDCR